MTETVHSAGSPVVLTLRYKDAATAIKWLEAAFGFLPHLIVPDDKGAVTHAQLICGNGMIMLGSVRDDEYGKLTRQPLDVGGSTQSPYIIVADVTAHHARAVAAGARIVYPIRDERYGGSAYSCCDLEGHLWNFGSYDPWSDPKSDGLAASAN